MNFNPLQGFHPTKCPTRLIIATETPILQGSTGFTTDPWKHDSDPIG